MWDQSDRWQRQTQLIAGVAFLICATAGLAVAVTMPAALRAWAGVRDVFGEVTSPARQTLSATVPASLKTRTGTLVYRDRADGVVEIMGRVVEVSAVNNDLVELRIRQLSPPSDPEHSSGTLKGAPASLNLSEVVRLLVNPDTPEVEAALARDAVWPSVREHVMPSMADNLIREMARDEPEFADSDHAILGESIDELRAELRPLEDLLADRLAKRAWNVVGVSGLAGGIWRSTTNSVEEQTIEFSDWWWRQFGSRSDAVPSVRPFLSEARSQVLRDALHEETRAFWQENRERIVAALVKVANKRRGAIESAFNERWGGRLFERVVLPAWKTGQEEVLESVQDYARDLAMRRLLNDKRGPRLLFAYALRSSLNISDEPLLVFSPGAPDRSGKEIVYEPLLR